MARFLSGLPSRIVGCALFVVLALDLLSANWRTQAQDDPFPSVAGDWNVKVGGQKLKLTITQKGREISGTARFPKSGTVAFEIVGTIDIVGELVLNLFWAESEKGPDVKLEAWAAAVKDRGADPKHQGMLQIKGLIRLQRKEDTSSATEMLEGKLQLPKLKVNLNKDTGAFEKLESITDEEIAAEITRDYAAKCAAEMGAIPPFNCLDGDLLKITVSGVEQTAPVAKCDRPVQLPLDGDGQCVPSSRLVRFPRSADRPKVLTIAICRKYKGSLAAEEFNDIAMVSHNEATGHTCFFQSPTNGVVYDGTTIPSPTDEDNASKVWGGRGADSTRGLFGPAGVRCNACHSAGPFLWSPYVGQVVSIDEALSKWNGEGIYHSNFANMFGTTSKLLTPKSNACRLCHRLGDGDSCRVHSPEFAKFKHTRGSEEKVWMPFGYAGTQADFDREYAPAMEQLARCCADPSLAECQSLDATPENTGGRILNRPVRRDR
jgi:hypothetical protein